MAPKHLSAMAIALAAIVTPISVLATDPSTTNILNTPTTEAHAGVTATPVGTVMAVWWPTQMCRTITIPSEVWLGPPTTKDKRAAIATGTDTAKDEAEAPMITQAATRNDPMLVEKRFPPIASVTSFFSMRLPKPHLPHLPDDVTDFLNKTFDKGTLFDLPGELPPLLNTTLIKVTKRGVSTALLTTPILTGAAPLTTPAITKTLGNATVSSASHPASSATYTNYSAGGQSEQQGEEEEKPKGFAVLDSPEVFIGILFVAVVVASLICGLIEATSQWFSKGHAARKSRRNQYALQHQKVIRQRIAAYKLERAQAAEVALVLARVNAADVEAQKPAMQKVKYDCHIEEPLPAYTRYFGGV